MKILSSLEDEKKLRIGSGLRRTVAAKDQVRVLSNKERLRKCDTSLLSNDPNVRYRLMRGRITVDAREKD